MVTVLKTLREHWKKTIFFTTTFSYGIYYTKEKIHTFKLVQKYCEEASKYGDERISALSEPKNVTVILNPNANRRKTKQLFEKYCEPLLHLAGLKVDILLTEAEGHAKVIFDRISSNTNALIVAGGDGTLDEVITGLIRSNNNKVTNLHNYPIGVLPLGRTNTLASYLFPNENLIKSMLDATIAIIREKTKAIDVMKIQVLEETPADFEGEPLQPVYAVGEIEWGVFRDAKAKRDKYWLFGPLRDYATYVFNVFSSSKVAEATLKFTPPCTGCKNCTIYEPHQLKKSNNAILRFLNWGAITGGKQKAAPASLKIINDKCNETHEIEIKTSCLKITSINTITKDKIINLKESTKDDLNIVDKTILDEKIEETNGSTLNSIKKETEISAPYLNIKLAPEKISYFGFIRQGWNNSVSLIESLQCRTVELLPKSSNEEDEFFIDNETFEVKPISVKLLPKILFVFCKE